MFGSIYGIVLLALTLSNSINFGLCQSPCPDVFKYEQFKFTGEVVGKISISNVPKNVAMHIEVTLSIAMALPPKLTGRLELTTSKSAAVKAVREGKELSYIVYFPLRHPIPRVNKITFNGRLYCTGLPAIGQTITTILLEHTLYPPEVTTLSGSVSDSNFPKFDGNVPSLAAADSSGPVSAFDEKDDTLIKIEPALNNYNENCGRANYNGVNFLIAHGERTFPGQFPWLVAIFIAKKKYDFHCAGSLITKSHIITAAHCKKLDDIDVPASAFIVSVGRYQLEQWRERGSRALEVREFRLHPEYRSRKSADADIAIIVLRDAVQFTPRIQPLCLWDGPDDLERVIGRTGFVVGWGRDENGNQLLKEPRMAQMPIVSQDECISSDYAFKQTMSNRTFCAGRRDGSGPCNGDSGSAFVILNSSTGRYYLRGVVSLSFSDENTWSCDFTKYVVYADAAKYLDWIRTQIN